MKKVIQIVLAIAIVILAYVVYMQIMTPLNFQKEMKVRERAVIEKITHIRTAERAYKQANQKYTGSFDTLIHFLLNDSLEFERSIGSADDSVAVAKGLVKQEKFRVAAIDTVFSPNKLTAEQIGNLRYIPHGKDDAQYILAAGNFQTESKVTVPVFEAKAPYKTFLWDLDEQELINLINERVEVFEKYPGIKVGALDQATNDAGNWE